MSMSVTSSIIPLVLVVLVLAATAFLPRREVGHTIVGLVRVLFPSWRFFDDVQVTPVLLVREFEGDGLSTEWHPLLTPPIRAWPLSLLWNPAGNLQLAEHVLLERLLSDVADWNANDEAGPESLVSYDLVVNLVRAKLAPTPGSQRATHFQFKLVEAPDAPGHIHEDLLISREHPT